MSSSPVSNTSCPASAGYRSPNPRRSASSGAGPAASAARAITGLVAVGTTVAVIVAVVATAGGGSKAVKSRQVQVSAPSFVLGDVDAVVLSSTFDEDGARNLITPAVQRAVAKVPGVESVSGVIDTFARVVDDRTGQPDYSRRRFRPARRSCSRTTRTTSCTSTPGAAPRLPTRSWSTPTSSAARKKA